MSVPLVPEDDELLAQLAHLDALEQRERSRYDAGEAGDQGERSRLEVAETAPVSHMTLVPLAVQPRWPATIPAPPAPGPAASSPAPYIAWLEHAAAEVAARVEANRGELERLRSQWVHVLRHLQRLRPEEIDGVVEAQAHLRETIANDGALHDVLRATHDQLVAWVSALSGPLTDPGLVRRLLDDMAGERHRHGEATVAAVVDLLSGMTLDLEVVQRTVARDPGQSTILLTQLRDRVNAAAEQLRDERAPIAGLGVGEPLSEALKRIAERQANWVDTTLTWAGREVADADVAGAVAWVVDEVLRRGAELPGGRVEVEIEVEVEDGSPQQVAVRIATPAALVSGDDESWLLRSQARTALAGGRLLSGRGDRGGFVEARFP